MKYLKKFENAHKKYKKYIICDDVRWEGDTITVYLVGYGFGANVISLKPIISYSIGKLIDRTDNANTYYENINTLKIYDQSDDQEDLIKMLPYIADKNNFNL